MNTHTTSRIVAIVAASLVILVGFLYTHRTSAPTNDCSTCPSLAVAAEAETAVTDTAKTATAGTDSVTTVAYYFYTTQRCPSCYKIESYSHEAIERDFAADLQSGRLVWKMVNIDEPANKHFVDDYKLITKALVLVDYASGTQLRWKNCQRVWELLNDKSDYQAYVKREVLSFLAVR